MGLPMAHGFTVTCEAGNAYRRPAAGSLLNASWEFMLHG
jgi:hypothetical protein